MRSPLETAILKTIHYADIFDYPLTAEEIQRYLIEHPTNQDVEEILTLMAAESRLTGAAHLYCLPDREEIIRLRKRRQTFSQPKLRRAKRVAAMLKFIPWVKLTGVTGALAMENSNENDDIDLMIITAPKRLWLTRGIAVTLLRLTGQYRRAGKTKDMICPNLMISEDVLGFPDRDLFTAHEIVQMRPIFKRDRTYQKFLQANKWVGEFLPNAIETNSKFKIQSAKSSSKLKTTKSFLNLLENTAYKLQLKYMSGKKTTEVTTISTIRFHPNDARKRVLDEYQKRVYTFAK